MDEKPYTLGEILLQNIDHFQFDDIHIDIFAKGGKLLVITLPDAKNVIKKKIGYRKSEVEFTSLFLFYID